MLRQIVFVLVLGTTSATHPAFVKTLSDQWENKADPGICIALHCALQSGACVLDPQCFETLQCMIGCSGKPDESQCQFECEMTLGNGNEVFEDLLRCMAANGCFPEVPPDGICLASESDTVQEITDIEMVAGSWWVVRGVNCAQDDVWLGGYDWYPCQHERYLRLGDGWINNTTYTGGSDSIPTTDVLVTIPHATMPSPGLIRLEYDDEPLLPQIERWHIVSKPSDDYMMVFWCGTNPALDYNGGFVLSRTRTQNEMPSEIEEEFRRVAASLGVDYDAMCVTDNTLCEENP
ncbi:violaxanthin de-epoxidase, chloroplastic [Eurytemora carolleeae]|uniref:violaxanthin de-epoxidase, chloroplastic n=1 Tax=Eurytemora carolleeae TaxID=1294199 RepID=UPI000C786710|nr:violaxanthin de-epoxidase, chloroplastic [Eurytemora carolleeae]|eukprot:XP_023348717.1 violaxanthin de-epoxidase, chloroplastic-like [Eurytemora affinis]